jgi:hypothetical protein
MCDCAGHAGLVRTLRRSAPILDFGALGEATGSIRLGLLAHERAGQTSVSSERGHHRDAAHLQAGQDLSAGRHQRGHLTGDLIEQDRVALESVLIEISSGSASGPEREMPG